MRINKLLSFMGFCSRRAADKLIEEGRVTVDGRVAGMGEQVDEGADVCVDGKPIIKEEEKILIAFNKPVGIVCTATDKQGKDNIVDYINYGKRIYPIGRLDKASEGLILLTNNGEIMNRMLKASYSHEKEYVVDVNKDITAEFLKGMMDGVYIRELDKTTAKCQCEPIYDKSDRDKKPDWDGKILKSTRRFRIVLVQGMNRQVRRMCEAFGYSVKRLKRVRIMNIKLGYLHVGKYRNLSDREYKTLLKELGMNY